MTSDDRFGGTVSVWLEERAGTGAPDYLDDILGRTARTRQRPGWTSIERWPPMDISANRTALPSRFPTRSLALLAIIGLLIVAIAVAIIAVGSQQHRVPPPFGPARNGELLSSADGDIFAVDPRSGQTTPIIAGPTNDFGPMFSRDGTKFLFLAGGRDNGLDIVVANPDGSEAHVVTQVVNGPDWVDWSPDGTRIAFLSRTLDRGEINIVNVDGSGLHTLDVGQPANGFSWLPPEGNEIVFRGEHLADSDPPPAILAVHPDGSALRTVSTRPAVNDADFQDVAVSPDGTRVAYRYPGQDVFSVRVLDVQTGTELVIPSLPGRRSSAGRSLPTVVRSCCFAPTTTTQSSSWWSRPTAAAWASRSVPAHLLAGMGRRSTTKSGRRTAPR